MKPALLTNFIPPYRHSLYRELTQYFPDLQILISTKMESNRSWKVNHSGLNVIEQKGVSISRKWKHEAGFEEKFPVHFPTNTFQQLEKINPDVVVSVEMGFRSLMAMRYCRSKKKPFVLWVTLSEHTEKGRGKLRKVLRKKLLKRASFVFCNGRSGERYIRSLGYSGPLTFVPYTSDYLINNELRKPSQELKLFFSGQLNARKGVKEMVGGMVKLLEKRKDVRINLTVAGEGEEKYHFEKLAAHKNASISLLGRVNYNELKELYKKSDIYIYPTLADEWGVVVNEALSSGLVVLGSKYSQAVEELITENKNGWIFDPLNETDYTQKLENALKISHQDILKMKFSATTSVKELNPPKIAKRIYEVLSSLKD